MTRWLFCIARDMAIAVLVGSIYVAGSIMLAMLLAALLGVTLDEPFTVREQLALLVSSLLVTAGILVIPRILREEQWSSWPPLAIPQALGQLVGGLLLGVALVAALVAALFLAGWYTPPPAGDHAPIALLRALGPPLFSAFVVAMTEELLDRRLLFPILERSLGSWLALALGAAWFGITHLTNPHASPAAAVGIALGGGVTYTLAFIATRRVWLSVGLHWGWNGTLGPIFGLPVSGLDRSALGSAQVTGGGRSLDRRCLWPRGGVGRPAAASAVDRRLDLVDRTLRASAAAQRPASPATTHGHRFSHAAQLASQVQAMLGRIQSALSDVCAPGHSRSNGIMWCCIPIPYPNHPAGLRHHLLVDRACFRDTQIADHASCSYNAAFFLSTYVIVRCNSSVGRASPSASPTSTRSAREMPESVA